MIDSHAHLHDHRFDIDREELIEDIFRSGVKALINVGTDPADSARALDLAGRREGIFAAVGAHPHCFAEAGENRGYLMELERLLAAAPEKIVAVGEVGLDYFRLPEEGAEEVKKRQKEAFRAQIELAGAKKLPVIVHCRDAYEDCLEIISRFPRQKFLMHCYMASPTVTEKFLSLPEVFFSFAGNLTYPKDVQAPILRSAEMIPSGRVLVETDSPYLCPQPKRGRRNDPRNLPLIIQTLASLRGESREEVAAFTTAAATEFFALPKLSS